MEDPRPESYLRRIGLSEPPETDESGLAILMAAHLRTVPFENLDVYHRRGVPLDATQAVTKIVERGRGGWCFELNSAFALLLESLGFTVERLAASVLIGDGEPPTPDHLTLLVHLERTWLVDVGFGDSFTVPLPLPESGGTTTDLDSRPRPHRLSRTGDELLLEALGDRGWAPQFRAVLRDVDLAHFAPASDRLQHTPGLHWTETRFATRLTPTGRVTLLHDRLKYHQGDSITEVAVTEAEWHRLLAEIFSMGGMEPVDRPEPPDSPERGAQLGRLLERLRS